MQTNDILVALAIRHNGDWGKIYEDVSSKCALEEKEVNESLKKVKDAGLKAITILDVEYPECLKHIYRPPFVLFCKGNLDLLNKNTISIFGTREPKEDIDKKIEKIFGNCGNDFAIINGNSRGVQHRANIYAIEKNIPIILVLPNGFENPYPFENKPIVDYACENGLVISEYPFEDAPKQTIFPQRDKLIIGLSKKTLFFDFHKFSGATLAIDIALSQNKDVFVTPTDILSDCENNKYIKEGAIPLIDGSDLFID